MKKALLSIAVFVAALALYRCSKPISPENASDPGYRTPAQLTAAEKNLVQSSNRFAFKLFAEIAANENPDSNIFISPLSVSYALAMTYNGAAGDTRDAMAQTLGIAGIPIEEVNESYRGLTDVLIHADPEVRFDLHNSIWYRVGVLVQAEFKYSCETYYDALIKELNFCLPTATDTINNWVNDNTNGLIDRIIEPPINRGTVMYLINAIYFNGLWDIAFDPEDNFDTIFYRADGSQSDCTIMQLDTVLYYLARDDFQAIDLPYGLGSFSMTLLLPDPDKTTDDIIAMLNDQNWADWTDSFMTSRVRAGLPKFRFGYGLTLNSALKALGMEIAFDEILADFSNMVVEGDGIWIDTVLHKSFIQVNEEGTEAAAVTLVEMMRSCPELIFNRPFLFIIHEKESSSILFMGKIAEPIWQD